MSYTRKERARARADKKPLFTLAYDTRHMAGGCEVVYQGVGDEWLMLEIRALILRATERESKKLTAAAPGQAGA